MTFFSNATILFFGIILFMILPAFSVGLTKKLFVISVLLLSIFSFVVLYDSFLKILGDKTTAVNFYFLASRIFFILSVIITIIIMNTKIDKKIKVVINPSADMQSKAALEKWVNENIVLPKNRKAKSEFKKKIDALKVNAVDYLSENCILDDCLSYELIKLFKINIYDADKDIGWGIIIRLKQMDEWIKSYIEENKKVTVLNTESYLDTRVFRINPSSDVKWFDCGFYDMMRVRKSIFKENDNYTILEKSFYEMILMDEFPKEITTEMPILIIAEFALLFYFKSEHIRTILEKITANFIKGQIIFCSTDQPGNAVDKLDEKINIFDTMLKRKIVFDVRESSFYNKKEISDREALLISMCGKLPSMTLYCYEWQRVMDTQGNSEVTDTKIS